MTTFITGDIHGDVYSRFNESAFPEGQKLTKDDTVIICGDFGFWNESREQKDKIEWLEKQPWTTLFCDGNHENFNLLYAQSIEKRFGGNVHVLSPSVLHLMRGEVFDIGGHSFFVFGGAASQDISGGILDKNAPDFDRRVFMAIFQGLPYRIRDVSWWEAEQASEEEFQHGLNTLTQFDYKVDFVVTHDPTVDMLAQLSNDRITYQPDKTSKYLQKVQELTEYKKWFFGHMHQDRELSEDLRATALYFNIIKIID